MHYSLNLEYLAAIVKNLKRFESFFYGRACTYEEFEDQVVGIWLAGGEI